MRIHDYLEYWADVAPDRYCVQDGQRAWSYGEVAERATRFAHVLDSIGLGDGDRFAVVAKNRAEWAFIYYGAFKRGAVPVPLNFRQQPQEWAYQLNDSGAKLVLAEDSFANGIEEIVGDLPATPSVIAIDADRSGSRSLERLLSGAPSQPVDKHIEVTHDLYQMYTSGTTGRPKGAVLTHAAVNANVTQVRTALPLHPGDDTLVVMPLFHAGAAMALFWGIAAGATFHIKSDFDPSACVRTLDEDGVVLTILVPAMIQAMLVDVRDVNQRSYERLRAIAYGASPIAEQTLRRALDVFGCDFYQVYGQTEAGAGLTLLGPDAHRRALESDPNLLLSCGRPLVGTRLAVFDEADRPVPAGTIGEICAQGPQLMREYWNLPEDSAVTLANGWLHTGDAGYVDEEGFLYICDRVKDMIVSGGENVYPREIEDVLYQMPGVAEAAVVGVPDQRWGETVLAVVVCSEGVDLEVDAVIAFCRERLASYKSPRDVRFVSVLPRNATGKVQKTVLREPYWQGRSRRVG